MYSKAACKMTMKFTRIVNSVNILKTTCVLSDFSWSCLHCFFLPCVLVKLSIFLLVKLNQRQRMITVAFVLCTIRLVKLTTDNWRERSGKVGGQKIFYESMHIDWPHFQLQHFFFAKSSHKLQIVNVVANARKKRPSVFE